MGGSSGSSSSSRRNANEYSQSALLVSKNAIEKTINEQLEEIVEIMNKETAKKTTTGIIAFTADTVVIDMGFHDRGNIYEM